jgi:hypothetical protein
MPVGDVFITFNSMPIFIPHGSLLKQFLRFIHNLGMGYASYTPLRVLLLSFINTYIPQKKDTHSLMSRTDLHHRVAQELQCLGIEAKVFETLEQRARWHSASRAFDRNCYCFQMDAHLNSAWCIAQAIARIFSRDGYDLCAMHPTGGSYPKLFVIFY